MKGGKFYLVVVIVIFAALLVSGSVFAVEEPPGEEPEPTLELTLQNETQMQKAKALSEASGVPVEEIIKMRLGIGEDGEATQKMGWGVIAKQLGVHPSVLGKGQAKMMADEEPEDGILAIRVKKRSERLMLSAVEREKVKKQVRRPSKRDKAKSKAFSKRKNKGKGKAKKNKGKGKAKKNKGKGKGHSKQGK